MGLFSPKFSRFNPDVPYLTESERRAFKAMREGSSISFFRTKLCDLVGCGQETMKGKRCCSKKCYDTLLNDIVKIKVALLKARK